MYKRAFGWVIVVLMLGMTGTAKVSAQEMDVSFFYDSLAPFGEWIDVAPYGWVWTPYGVAPEWRPYIDGRWVYSDFGWTFVSPEDWGWAAYHYGRWVYSAEYGWIWVPGTVWGPAWVAWRYGGNFIGWAPLPPEAGWSFDSGLMLGGFDMDYGLDWDYWNFVELSRFMDRDLRRYVISSTRNINLIRETRNVTDYKIVNHRIVDDNIDLARITRATGRKIRTYRITELQEGTNTRLARLKGTEIAMFRPAISSRRSATVPRNIRSPRQELSQQKLERQQQKERERLNGYYRTQEKDLEKRHRRELKNPPQGVSREELTKRQQQETQALRNHQINAARIMERRQERERDRHMMRPQNENKGRGTKKK